MYDKLKTAYGAVSKKGVSSILTKMRIKNGLVVGTNGSLTIGVQVPELEHLDITLAADKFLKAIATADPSKLKMKVTDTGRLSITAGKFRALIPTIPNDSFPEVQIDGNMLDCNNILEGLKCVAPFMGDDAIRVWSNGVRLTKDFMYATNNVSMVKYEVRMIVPDMVIPRGTVTELLRINKEPVATVADDSSVTFIMDDETWVNSQTIDSKWPDVEHIFVNTDTVEPVHPELAKAVKDIVPFCNDMTLPAIYFSKDGITTSEGDLQSTYEGIELPDACFHADLLNILLPHIEQVDWSHYPKPCPFLGAGGKLTGVCMGLIT